MKHFRPNSWDADIWKAVVENNEYGIDGVWEGDVLDIGGHIGSFAHFAIEKLGARVVVSVEPDPNNFALLQANLKDYVSAGRVLPMNLACSSSPKARLEAEAFPIENTGGMRYEPSDDGDVACIRLEELCGFLQPPILLKIDCEGCEFDAFATCGDIPAIHAIVGEYHCGRADGHSLGELKALLESKGFVFSSKGSDTIGLFGAHRA